MSHRIGLGYDIHRFADGLGEHTVHLGGVGIPYERRLLGHSDADVVLHALCDALLGALAKGDIGDHFPNTDPKYKGIESIKLLREVMTIVKADNYKVNNADITIQAEEPNLKEYKQRMSEIIAPVLGVSVSQVNIKATTQEQIGSIGRKEGIAAFAVVLLTQ